MRSMDVAEVSYYLPPLVSTYALFSNFHHDLDHGVCCQAAPLLASTTSSSSISGTATMKITVFTLAYGLPDQCFAFP